MSESKETGWSVVGENKMKKRTKGKGGVTNLPVRFRKPRPVAERVGALTLGDVAATAAAGYKMGKYLISLINSEMKTGSTSAVSAAVDYNGTVINLSNIAQGTDVNTRDGDSILLQYQSLGLKMYNNVAATSGSVLRAMIVRDNEQDGVDPTPSQILDSPGSTLGVVGPLNFFSAMPGTDRKHRFEIMFDRRYTLAPTVTMIQTDVWEQYYKAGNKHILYDATAAADASNREGSLFLVLISDQQTNTVIVDYFHRLLFTDN